MFKKHIIMLIAAVLLTGSIFTGCDWLNEKSASQKRQEELIAKLDQDKKDKDEAIKETMDYTYRQRVEFIDSMNKELAEIQKDLDQLSEKAEKTKSEAKADAKIKLDALRQEMELTKKHIKETENSDEQTWEDVKKG
ncbi:MAG TPA: hypothetical protein PLZ43_15960, partial [bacterium]|nr:hypothetical protein [bacterium]